MPAQRHRCPIRFTMTIIMKQTLTQTTVHWPLVVFGEQMAFLRACLDTKWKPFRNLGIK